VRARLPSAALAAALLALPGSASGRDAERPDPAPLDPAPEGAPAPAPPVAATPPPPGFPVRPILLVGLGGTSGGLTLGADLGLRVAPVTARWAWRGAFLGSGDYLIFQSGRLGWIFAERRWISAHAGVGAGRLTRAFEDTTGPSVSSTAVVGEIGALLMPAWLLGPMLAVELEAVQPVGGTSPAGAHLTAPVVSFMVNVNLAVVLRAAIAPH
jgi:hypothetical protein